ncbi:MAG: hypothetical protein IK066_05270 [Kiritimatiellae bacterium]|nr:hypothetical protein [Kiritimatiellia bacterium]
MRFSPPAFHAALAAVLLVAAGAASVVSAKSLPDEVPPPMPLAFRAVDDSADPEAIFRGGENLPDGFEPAGSAALWRRVGPPPDAGELARIARFADRPGCDLVLERRIVDGETLYAPLFVFSTPELTGGDVADAAIRRSWVCWGGVLHFDFHPNAAPKLRQLMRTLKAGGSRAPRGGKTTGRFAVLADGRLLGVARRYPFDFPCAGNRKEAEAVVQAYRALPATHLYTVTPCKTSGLTATEARDRAAADMPNRWLTLFSSTPDVLLPQIACEGENGLAIALPPGRADRQRMWLAVLLMPMGVTFRPVTPENDAWARELFAAPPPEGWETVTAPDGAPAWVRLDGGKAGEAADGTDGGGDDDDDDDGNPDLGPAAEREGCLLAWENLRLDTGNEAADALPAYSARRPCYLSADSVLDVAAVAAAVPVKVPGGDENAIRVDLRPEERAVLEDMARALAPGQRIAFLYSDRVQSLSSVEDILSGAPLFVRYTPAGGFGAPKENWLESFISSIARFLEAGLVPADFHYEGTR